MYVFSLRYLLLVERGAETSRFSPLRKFIQVRRNTASSASSFAFASKSLKCLAILCGYVGGSEQMYICYSKVVKSVIS